MPLARNRLCTWALTQAACSSDRAERRTRSPEQTRSRIADASPAAYPFGGPNWPLSRANQRKQSFCLSVSERVAPSAADSIIKSMSQHSHAGLRDRTLIITKSAASALIKSVLTVRLSHRWQVSVLPHSVARQMIFNRPDPIDHAQPKPACRGHVTGK